MLIRVGTRPAGAVTNPALNRSSSVMSHFRLHIDTDNAAFGDDHQDVSVAVAAVLRQVAAEVEQQALPDTCGFDLKANIRDINGNKIGHYHRYEHEDGCA